MTTDELEIWKALNECEVVKKVFYKTHGLCLYDFMFCIPSNRVMCRAECLHCDLECEDIANAVWVPNVYDPIRPERSLWGMSKKFREESGPGIAVMFMIRDRPDLELAKAIIEQEKGEGNGRQKHSTP